MGETQVDAAQPTAPVDNATTASSAVTNVLPPVNLSSSTVDAVFADSAAVNSSAAASLDDHAVSLLGEDGGTADLALAAGMAMALSGSWGNVEWEPRRNQISGH
jgi:pyruvate/2-oxoacid:ferredoxin oxidoreductase beta subunit